MDAFDVVESLNDRSSCKLVGQSAPSILTASSNKHDHITTTLADLRSDRLVVVVTYLLIVADIVFD